MSTQAALTLTERWEKLDKGQLLKWTIYSLLILNWFYYFFEEFYIAQHTLRQGGTFWQWTEEFATSIDAFAWIGLLLMFELETYALEDETLEKRWVIWGLHGLRVVFYAMLLHTVVARLTSINDTLNAEQRPELTSLCQLTDEKISYGYNLRYEIITADNCESFSADPPFYFPDPSVVMDQPAYDLQKKHEWIDVSDVVIWILVIWSIELAVWLQNRNIAGGRLMIASYCVKVFYTVLFAHAAFWIYTGHWVYAWDQALWILGFWAIEKNLAEWRDEIREAPPDTALRPS